MVQFQRSPVRSRRCPATVVPFGGEPGRLSCADDIALEGRAVRTVSRSLPRAASRRHVPLPLALVGCAVLLLVTMTLGVAIGSVPLSPAAVWGGDRNHLTGHPGYSVADAIVWQIRLPRVLLAAVVGAALTTAGTVVQVLVRNALADPFLLGVSSGASVGATAVLLFGAFASLGVWAISAGSVLGALGAMAAVFLVSRQGRALAPTQLILCGVVLSALFESVTSFLIFRATRRPRSRCCSGCWDRSAWRTGRSSRSRRSPLAAAIGYLITQARALNALALGPGRRRRWASTCSSDAAQPVRRDLAGWPGWRSQSAASSGSSALAVLHIVRLMVGSDHRRVLPVGALFGASFMVLGDLLARVIVAPQEMPIGVITAFIGAPTLIVLIRRRPYLLRSVRGEPGTAGTCRWTSRGAGSSPASGLTHSRTAVSPGCSGPNGSGKSTVLKAIYRVHRPCCRADPPRRRRTCCRCGPARPPGGSRWWPRSHPRFDFTVP